MTLALRQEPKQCDLVFVVGDELPFAVNFGRNITNYTIDIKVFRAALSVPTGGGIAAITQGATVFTPDVQVVNASTGAVSVTFTEAHTAMLSPTGSYRWYVRWVTPGGQTRTLISGSVLPEVP